MKRVARVNGAPVDLLAGRSIVPADPAGHDYTLAPFAPTSVWRLGISQDAVFAPDSDPMNASMANVDAAGAAWINFSGYSHPVNRATVSDPLAAVTDSYHATTTIPPGGTWNIHIPSTARIASGSDAHMHVLDPNGLTLYEHYNTTKSSDTVYTCRRRHAVSLTGSGIGPQNGTRAYGGSAVGGLIRAWEVDPTHPAYTGAIKHALAVALRLDQLYDAGFVTADEGYGPYKADGTAREVYSYVWPATEPENGNSTSPATGHVPTGAYFAIPPTVDISTLGITTPEGLMVAKAAQDYGVYVTDGSGSSCFYIEDDGGTATGAFFTACTAPNSSGGNIKKVFKALRVVTNNSRHSPNGGLLSRPRRV